MDKNKPRLFGIDRSNRDYTNPDTWGKNQFNSSFPASLACYLYSKGLKAVYYKADKNMNRDLQYIGIDELYGVDPLGDDIYFSFETQYMPFQKYVVGSIPRDDLVILSKGQCVSSMEIKLVALPDNPTCNLSEDKFGSEIVVRPDTIIYLACSFIQSYDDDPEAVKKAIGDAGKSIKDWTQATDVLPYIDEIYWAIRRMIKEKNDKQVPIIMEPVWKTEGKSSKLADNCLDVFVWSNFGMLNLFMPAEGDALTSITRHTRKLAVVLDRDIKVNVPEFISNHKQYSGIKIDYLPIASLEKYLKAHLVDKLNNELFSVLDTYLFQKKPLNEIIREYIRNNNKDDSDGKAFYGVLLNEVKSMRKDREDLVDIVVRYILEHEEENIKELATYLSKKIDE